jgi:hypothetical protein
MKILSKAQKRKLVALARVAHDRELGSALDELHGQFARWKSGSITPQELSDRIHEFHNGPARALWVTYVAGDPRVAIAQAAASGILRADEIPPEVEPGLRSLIDYFKEDQ